MPIIAQRIVNILGGIFVIVFGNFVFHSINDFIIRGIIGLPIMLFGVGVVVYGFIGSFKEDEEQK